MRARRQRCGCARPARATAICRYAGGPNLLALLGVGLKLLLERSEFGKRRGRVRRLVAAALTPTLEILGAELGVAVRAVVARGSLAPLAPFPLGTVAVR